MSCGDSMSSFNSLQVGYKLPPIKFQSIGFIVSIPYRLATNQYLLPSSPFGQRFQFLIGWLQTSGRRSILHQRREFQFLIGWLQTSVYFFLCTNFNQFQFLIGWLQTGKGRGRLVSVPCFNSLQVGYKQHTCAPQNRFQSSFNSLQVGYKLFFCVWFFLTCYFVSIPYRLATNLTSISSPVENHSCFNSLQVGYKRRDILTRNDNEIGFNSLQVGYKLIPPLILKAVVTVVSIPYRLATNWWKRKEGLDVVDSFNSLQVGYKLKQSPCLLLILFWFQFLIGWLQT